MWIMMIVVLYTLSQLLMMILKQMMDILMKLHQLWKINAQFLRTTILVVQHTWIETQTAILKQLEKEKSVDVYGDGRSDSPGHSAKYGTYTLMDEKTNLIIEFSVVQVTEVP